MICMRQNPSADSSPKKKHFIGHKITKHNSKSLEGKQKQDDKIATKLNFNKNVIRAKETSPDRDEVDK